MISADERRAYLLGFKMALEATRTFQSRKVDRSAIVVQGNLEDIQKAMESASMISDKEIEKVIESKPEGLR